MGPENQKKLNDLTNKRDQTQEDIQAYTEIINKCPAFTEIINNGPPFTEVIGKCPALCEYTKIQERLDSLLEEFDGLDKQIDEIDFTLSSLKERLSEMQEPERKTFIFKMSWPDLKTLAKEMSIRWKKKLKEESKDKKTALAKMIIAEFPKRRRLSQYQDCRRQY